MSKRNLTIATAAFAGLLTLAPAFALQNQGATTGSSTAGAPQNEGNTEHQGMDHGMDKKGSMQVSSDDRKFMMEAAKGGMMEVEMGRIAAQKASSADVKSFGQRMVDDHGKANDQLKQLASQKGVTLPTTLPADMRKEMDKVSKLSGAEFDKMYMSHMLKDHHKDISEFEKEAAKGADSSLKSFAQTTLPTLREHLQMAQSIAPKVGASDSGDDHAMHGKSGSGQ
ncbi:MAG TPA: DUF4142 domain-containing protein [Thermoanaerobaculia bacterium]|nr:DUF4142 domain-containing protein [Thermoanaerobaculia bacterium]